LMVERIKHANTLAAADNAARALELLCGNSKSGGAMWAAGGVGRHDHSLKALSEFSSIRGA